MPSVCRRPLRIALTGNLSFLGHLDRLGGPSLLHNAAFMTCTVLLLTAYVGIVLQWLAWGWRSPLADGNRSSGPDPGVLAQAGWTWQDLTTVGPHVLLAQTLLTALLAPLVCSLLLLLWKLLPSLLVMLPCSANRYTPSMLLRLAPPAMLG